MPQRIFNVPYSQKYVLAYFFDPAETSTLFSMSDWPIHVTLADVFAVDRHGRSIDEKLASLFAKTPAVGTVALKDDILGTTPVVLLDKTSPLVNLHTAIVSLLRENGATFNTPEFTMEGFLPHSTIQKSGRIHAGDTVTVDSVSLVDMFPGSDWTQRRVLTTFPMKQRDP